MQSSCRPFALLLAAACAAPAFAQAPPTELAEYVRKDDPSFAWSLAGKTDVPAGTVYHLKLTSQTWHDIKWEHGLEVYVPKGAGPQPTMVLFNTGGDPSPAGSLLGLTLAEKVKAPVAFLFNVPNQPLFGGKKEDALIADTFLRYLKTKDPSWPLLFPMAKSVVKAMDALQAFAKEEWKADVKDFVVSGASKRGWTSWLTAASGDKRVKAIAPLVIDTLNMPAQIENQKKSYGAGSEQIRDYTDNGLFALSLVPEGRKLMAMVDPYTYREQLTLPKMLIFGTNDRYWPQDALNSYWGALKGEKHVLYVPNAGHNLQELKDGKREQVPTRAVNTMAEFFRSQVYNKPMPKLTWANADKDGKAGIEVKSDRPMKEVRLFEATAKTRDFRDSKWTVGQTTGKGATAGEVSAAYPTDGLKAILAEVEYDDDGLTYTLSTQIRILEPKK